MNRTIIALATILIAVVAAVAIVTCAPPEDDGVVDGEGGVGEPTVGQIYMWPTVNEPEWGSLVMGSYDPPYLEIIAVPEDGCIFDGWTYTTTGDTYSVIDAITVSLEDDVPELMANFEAVDGKIVQIDWDMPVFTSNGISQITIPETYVSAITYDNYMSVSESDVPRNGFRGDSVAQLVIADQQAVTIADYLNSLTEDMTNLQKAIVLMYFVQDVIEYSSDYDLYKQSEWWATPIETVWSGKGDCEDTAILYATVGALMGLDTGLIAFDYVDAGHIGAAIALKDDESVTGRDVTTFVIDGVTYLYIETADSDDPELRPPAGYLMSPYDIANGKFTSVSYDTESESFDIVYRGLISGDIEPRIGFIEYGVSLPAVSTMTVGDIYIYHVPAPFDSDMVMVGDALASEGGFLEWDPSTSTLTGSPSEVGTYTLTITAFSSEDGVAYMDLMFDVRPSGSGSSTDYQSGSWTVVDSDGEVVDSSGDETVSIPPSVPMSVGDTFLFSTDISIGGADVVVVGDGLDDYGGFLEWDPDTMTLSGTADAEGVYRVVLTAYWSSGTGLYQTAYQIVTLQVGPADGESRDMGLVYDSEYGDWTIIGGDVTPETPTDTDDTDDGGRDNTILYAVVIVIVVLVVGFTVVRRAL